MCNGAEALPKVRCEAEPEQRGRGGEDEHRPAFRGRVRNDGMMWKLDRRNRCDMTALLINDLSVSLSCCGVVTVSLRKKKNLTRQNK